MKLSVCLVGCRGEANLGSVLRLQKNFGVEHLYLVEPRVSVTATVRDYACHAIDLVDSIRQYPTLKELLATENFALVLASSAKGGQDRPLLSLPELQPEHRLFQGLTQEDRILLVFGREDVGLHSSELHFCHACLKIETGTDYPVINLSHAVAIILNHLNNFSWDRVGQESELLAGTLDVSALEVSLQNFLDSFSYYQKEERHYHRQVLSSLLRAHPYTASQIRFLHGILRVYRNNTRKKS